MREFDHSDQLILVKLIDVYEERLRPKPPKPESGDEEEAEEDNLPT